MKKITLDEVIIVEGRHDIAMLSPYVEATFVATEGSAFPIDVQTLLLTYAKQGKTFVIFTDPDVPGELIRKQVQALLPDAKHAFIEKKKARTTKKVGVEHARPEALLEALAHAVTLAVPRHSTLAYQDLYDLGLVGTNEASLRRQKVYATYGLGYGSAKTLWKRLNALQEDVASIQEKMGW